MPIASRSRIVRATPIGIDPCDSSAADGHGRTLEYQELMSEGKNLGLQRCTSLKDLPSRRKQRANDREHVAEKLQRRPPNSTSSVRTEFLVGTAVSNQLPLPPHTSDLWAHA